MEFDLTKRKAAKALVAPGLIHGAVESAFPERKRTLWRIDRLNGKTYLLLLSEDKPDLSNAVEQFGTENGWETRSYDSFLAKIENGDKRCFRLCANPVITKSAGTGNRGAVLAHVTVKQQEQWLMERAGKHGFHVETEQYSAVYSDWVTFHKGNEGGRPVSFHMVTFEGLLTVTDAELFRETLVTGIGREKAYGCGMLTVTGKEV